MAAYVIAQVKVKDPEKLAAYSQAAGPTVAEFGGKLIVRAPALEVLSGDVDYDRCVIMEFGDAASARAWYNSEAYQALVPLRSQGADVVFTLAEAAE